MTRMSKQGKRRALSPRRPSRPAPKKAVKNQDLKQSFKPQVNALANEQSVFIGKVK